MQINEFEKVNQRLVDEQKVRLQSNSAEYNKAHELTSKLQGLEAKYYSLEVDERGKNTDLEAVNYSNQALMDRNLDLKSEYEALQKHITILTQQNKDLQRELDSFVETDDIVRRNLDRKEKVDEIRSKVDCAINASMSQFPKASPRRSPIQSQGVPRAGGQGISASQFNLQNVNSNATNTGANYYNNRDFSPAKRGTGNFNQYRASPLRQKSGSPARY